MAWSLAEDGDLRYEARDVLRVRREFPGGPQGIFLKRTQRRVCVRTAPGASPGLLGRVRGRSDRIYFAKAFAYPLVGRAVREGLRHERAACC